MHNVNTSTDLFNSTLTSQSFNATFTLGQVLIINNVIPAANNCGTAPTNILRLTLIFIALAILLVPIFMLFIKGKLTLDVNAKLLIVVFIGIIIGIVFIEAIADSIILSCG